MLELVGPRDPRGTAAQGHDRGRHVAVHRHTSPGGCARRPRPGGHARRAIPAPWLVPSSTTTGGGVPGARRARTTPRRPPRRSTRGRHAGPAGRWAASPKAPRAPQPRGRAHCSRTVSRDDRAPTGRTSPRPRALECRPTPPASACRPVRSRSSGSCGRLRAVPRQPQAFEGHGACRTRAGVGQQRAASVSGPLDDHAAAPGTARVLEAKLGGCRRRRARSPPRARWPRPARGSRAVSPARRASGGRGRTG